MFNSRNLCIVLSKKKLYSSSIKQLPLTTFTEEQITLREMVQRFAQDVVQPKVAEMDEKEQLDPEILRGLFDNGDFGGPQMTFTDSIIVVEELAKVDPSVSVVCDVHNTLVNNIMLKYASDKQKQQYLPKLATSQLGSFCLSETSSGSDAFALKTTAMKQTDGTYLLNGSKMWITNSHEAEIFLVFANVNPKELGYKGITCFLVERTDPGFNIHKKERKLGIRASSTCAISFDNIRLSESRGIGPEGMGYKIAIDTLNDGRIGIAAQMLGLAKGVVDHAIPYLLERKQFNQTLSSFQGIQHQVAQMATEIEAASLLTYNACAIKESFTNHPNNGNRDELVKAAAMAKLYASQVAQKASSQAIEWMGGVGFTRDFPVEKYYRDCKIGTIYEGTSNIQLNTIAKSILSPRQ